MYSRFPKPWFPYLNFLKIQLQILEKHSKESFLSETVSKRGFTSLRSEAGREIRP